MDPTEHPTSRPPAEDDASPTAAGDGSAELAEQAQQDHDVPAGPEDRGHLWAPSDWAQVVADADAIARRQDQEEAGL